jgi:hypothetical protein
VHSAIRLEISSDNNMQIFLHSYVSMISNAQRGPELPNSWCAIAIVVK